MPAIAALLESRAALIALRRTLPKGGPSVVTCRNPAALHRLLETRLVDAVVLAPQPDLLPDLVRPALPPAYVPVVAYAPFRPDDGELLLACPATPWPRSRSRGSMIPSWAIWCSARRSPRSGARALVDAPRMLRLTEPLQRAAWDLLLGEVERPMRTTALASRLRISREHLSRQFGAGGAPNLKRVIDLTRIACAAQLLGNPGYAVQTVVRVLHFSSSNHLAGPRAASPTCPPAGWAALGPRGVLAAFVRGNTRSGYAGSRLLPLVPACSLPRIVIIFTN